MTQQQPLRSLKTCDALSLAAQDAELKCHLESLSQHDEEYWTFRGKARREHVHSYFLYPAMMVPQMQGRLMRSILQVQPDIHNVYDPFMGSGTILSEAMMQGLGFGGRDINPLAVLLCHAKTCYFDVEEAQAKINRISECISRDTSTMIAVEFPNREKWFQTNVSEALSKIRRAIIAEPSRRFRQFLWVALAETVRLTSNDRTSTYKLHMRPLDEVAMRATNPIVQFEAVLYRNVSSMNIQQKLLRDAGWLHSYNYSKPLDLMHGDARDYQVESIDTTSNAPYDLLVTSPPYGDNATTITYGQHSYLPLQWIDLADIDEHIDHSWLATTQAIDRKSLGGSLQNALKKIQPLRDISPNLNQIIDDLKGEKRDRAIRVAAFYYDLNACLDPILAALKPGAYMIWTLGNRSVGKRRIPLDTILIELLKARGAIYIHRFARAIPVKRQPIKNNHTQTINKEVVIVMRK